MSKREDIKNKISAIEDEFYVFSSLYNLHIIQIKNLYNHALLETYSETYGSQYDIASLYGYNQVLLYDIHNRRDKIINMSLAVFNQTWKKFISKIEEESIEAQSKEFYEKINKLNFINCKISRITRNNIYFEPVDNKTLQTKNLIFKYSPVTLDERNFILKDKNIWVYIRASIKHKIKTNPKQIIDSKEKIIYKTDMFNKELAVSAINHIAKKIHEKSSGKITISIKTVDRKRKVIVISINKYLPVSFINHIKKYVDKNCLYTVVLEKKKEE